MRTETEILSKLKKLQGKLLIKMAEHGKKRIIENCAFNILSELEKPSEELPRLCFNPNNISRNCVGIFLEEGKYICNPVKIRECKYFKTKYTPEVLNKKFLEVISDKEFLAQNYRDIFMLQWVLDNPTLTWWDKFISKVIIYYNFIFNEKKGITDEN